jgi:hypothetical protein
MPMDSISMCSNTFYMSNTDEGSILRWRSASTMTQRHHFESTNDPIRKKMSKKCGYDCVRLLLHAHGQHINLFKHFVYVHYGLGKQFEVPVSLNQNVMTIFLLHK